LKDETWIWEGEEGREEGAGECSEGGGENGVDVGGVGAFPNAPGAFERPEAGENGEDGVREFEVEGVGGRSGTIGRRSGGVDTRTGVGGEFWGVTPTTRS